MKDAIAKLCILNLFVADRKVASIRLKPPFDEIIKHPLVLNGARQPSRYLLFHIPVVLEKKIHLVHNGKFAKGYEKVVVREVGVSSDSQRYSDEGVLARQRR